MNYNVDTIIFWLATITAYAFIYRSVCAVASLCSKLYASRKAAKAHTRNLLLKKQNLLNLSKTEIATLKFLLAQSSRVAWLPASSSTTALLKQKGFIKPFGRNIKNICDNSKSFQEAISHAVLFTVPSDIAQLISLLPQEHFKAWRKGQPDRSLAQYQ